MYFEREPGYLQQKKIALCEAQNWRCCYCKFEVIPIFGETTRQDAATKEHLIPRAKGGRDTDDNLVIACALCNQVRDHDDPFFYEEVVAKLLSRPEIKRFWHRFSMEQVLLLRKEVEFALAVAVVEKKESPYAWKRYSRLLQKRKAQIENLRRA